jgi:uncharacterized membrane protein YdjX (TVP38/TMEM64 family)
LALPAEAPAPPLGPALAKAGALMAALVLAGLLFRHAGTDALRTLRPDARGALLLVIAGGLMTAAGLPRQVLAFSAGFVFGAPAGTAWALFGQLLGCLLDYIAARTVLGTWARRHIAGRWRKLDRFLAARPFAATLTMRLLPVSNNLALNLLAGVTAISPVAFLSASLLGYVPQTVIFALLGSGVHVGERLQLFTGLALFAAAALLGVALWRRQGAN